MVVLWDVLLALFSSFGVICLGWLIFGKLVLPAGTEDLEVTAVVSPCGDGGDLEQVVSGLLWLRRMGLWRGRTVIRGERLNPAGLSVARKLAARSGVELRV